MTVTVAVIVNVSAVCGREPERGREPACGQDVDVIPFVGIDVALNLPVIVT